MSRPLSTMTTLPVAGFWRRLAALVYDLLIVIALLMVAAAIGTLVAELLVPGLNTQTPDTLRRHPLYLAWLLLWWFGYYAWSWRKGGQTVGMKAWRMQVQSSLGGQLLAWQITVRLGVSIFVAALLLAIFSLLKHLDATSWNYLAFLPLLALQWPPCAVQEKWSQSQIIVLPKPDKP
ncbi:MAG: RDD family protein [Permianibacter sp.]